MNNDEISVIINMLLDHEINLAAILEDEKRSAVFSYVKDKFNKKWEKVKKIELGIEVRDEKEQKVFEYLHKHFFKEGSNNLSNAKYHAEQIVKLIID